MLNAQLEAINLHYFKVHNHLLNYDDKCSNFIQASRSSLATLAEGSDEEGLVMDTSPNVDIVAFSFFDILFVFWYLLFECVLRFQNNVCNVLHYMMVKDFLKFH
jgi:hypothetical protein